MQIQIASYVFLHVQLAKQLQYVNHVYQVIIFTIKQLVHNYALLVLFPKLMFVNRVPNNVQLANKQLQIVHLVQVLCFII